MPSAPITTSASISLPSDSFRVAASGFTCKTFGLVCNIATKDAAFFFNASWSRAYEQVVKDDATSCWTLPEVPS
jgi:hypothetical protein